MSSAVKPCFIFTAVNPDIRRYYDKIKNVAINKSGSMPMSQVERSLIRLKMAGFRWCHRELDHRWSGARVKINAALSFHIETVSLSRALYKPIGYR